MKPLQYITIKFTTQGELERFITAINCAKGSTEIQRLDMEKREIDVPLYLKAYLEANSIAQISELV